jgi:hypothetical protein
MGYTYFWNINIKDQMGGTHSMYINDINACRISTRKHERKIKLRRRRLTGKMVLKFILENTE